MSTQAAAVIFQKIQHLYASFSLVSLLPLAFVIIGIGLVVFLCLKLLPVFYILYQMRRQNNHQYVLLQVVIQQNTTESLYATEQLMKNLHSLLKYSSKRKFLIRQKRSLSLELVASKSDGIRYVIRVPKEMQQGVVRAVRSFLPGAVISEIPDYFSIKTNNFTFKSVELLLRNHFMYSLKVNPLLSEYDPISYITSHMTKLKDNEFISLHLILKAINKRISNKETKQLEKDEEIQKEIRQKLQQSLFDTTMRMSVVLQDKRAIWPRLSGILSAIGSTASYHQELVVKRSLFSHLLSPLSIFRKHQYRTSELRMSTRSKTILSVSEVATLFHFPYNQTTETEDIVKAHSRQLPAPLSLKQQKTLDVVFAKNTYGNRETEIGLTKEERLRHLYVIGATGTGKSTLLTSMIASDLKHGKGICVIDPHGDLAESLLNLVPEKRVKDVIYFNPYDIKYPIGVNLLELTKGLDQDELLLEKEFIAESVISLFRKVFSDAWSAHPHRIEYILRNTIHTAFTLENPTLFTVFDLLSNPQLQKQVVKTLQDEDLKNFWKYEFGRAGDYQKVKMVAPVTARIGRFLFSPSARRILEQQTSTINFDEIISSNKILICNLAKGNIGEDTSEVMGIMLLNKIQLAALKRARVARDKRNEFYLYVDEFQNFATPPFVQMLSEARKYGLNLVMAEQSTSQQKDRNLIDIVLANTGTVVMFRSANPKDEQLFLPQFAPYVKEGEIMNLPSFHFYIKTSAITPEEPFSGETIPVKIIDDNEKKDKIITSSRKHYAIEYVTKTSPEPLRITELGQEEIDIKPKVSSGAPV